MTKTKVLPIVLIIVFVDLSSLSLALPLLPYYAEGVGVTPQNIGFLVAIYPLCQLVASPILGNLSDKIGRRPLLIYCHLGSCIGFAMLGFAVHLPHPLFWLSFSRIVDGFSGGNLVIAQTCISDVSAPENRAKNYGLVSAAFSLGFLIGPTIGGYYSRVSYNYPAYIAAALSFVSFIITAFLLPETRLFADQKNERLGTRNFLAITRYIKHRYLRHLLLTFFLFVLPVSIYISIFALYAIRQLQFSAEQTGYFLSFVGLLGVIWQSLFVKHIVRRCGERKALLLGLFSSASGFFSIVMVNSWWQLVIATFFISFGNCIVRPTITSLIIQVVPRDHHGEVLGIATSIESLSRVVGPILGGWIISRLSPPRLGWVTGLFFFIAIVVALIPQSGRGSKMMVTQMRLHH